MKRVTTLLVEAERNKTYLSPKELLEVAAERLAADDREQDAPSGYLDFNLSIGERVRLAAQVSVDSGELNLTNDTKEYIEVHVWA